METKTKDETGYNGWTNYETWLVKLWIDNDQGLYEHWQDIVKEEGQTKYNLSQLLKDWHEEYMPLDDAGLWTDLLRSALSEVDWYEIAENMMEELF